VNRTQDTDSTGGGNFVLARDLDGGGVLLRYNPTSGNFEPFAPVDLGGEDILDGSTTVYDAATDTVGDGTTSADHESINTAETTTGIVGPDDDVRTFIISVQATSVGYANVVRFDHDGTKNVTVVGLVDAIYDSTVGGSAVAETDVSFIESNNDESWGSTGATTALSNNIRLKVDESDSSKLYLQLNYLSNISRGICKVSFRTASGATATII